MKKIPVKKNPPKKYMVKQFPIFTSYKLLHYNPTVLDCLKVALHKLENYVVKFLYLYFITLLLSVYSLIFVVNYLVKLIIE